MPDKKLTDSEIIKALECCSNNVLYEQCVGCPYEKYLDKGHTCIIKATKNALDLINRQKAEIEELDYKLGALLCYVTNGKLSKSTYPLATMTTAVDDAITDDCNDAKSEAVKEFAQRVKDDIDNLLNELVGETK